jgi:hypothetical protein
MDRTDAARSLAKVFAYLACNKPDAARAAAEPLIAWLRSL